MEFTLAGKDATHKTQTATLYIIHQMGKSRERGRGNFASGSGEYYFIADGQGGLLEEEILGQRAEGSKGIGLAKQFLDEAHAWLGNSKYKGPW